MQRLRVRMSKRGDSRFCSHLDFLRAIERAVRRAGLPLALTEGFNPRPRLSFASALAVGATSDAEYVDFFLDMAMDAGEFARRLGDALPPGVSALEVAGVAPDAPALMALIDSVEYEVTVPAAAATGAVEDRVRDFMGRPRILVMRGGKKGSRDQGVREVDIRPLIVEMRVVDVDGGMIELRLLLRAGGAGSVRPEEVVGALESFCRLGMDVAEARIHKRAVFWHDRGKRMTPWEVPQPAHTRPAGRAGRKSGPVSGAGDRTS